MELPWRQTLVCLVIEHVQMHWKENRAYHIRSRMDPRKEQGCFFLCFREILTPSNIPAHLMRRKHKQFRSVESGGDTLLALISSGLLFSAVDTLSVSLSRSLLLLPCRLPLSAAHSYHTPHPLVPNPTHQLKKPASRPCAKSKPHSPQPLLLPR